MAVCRPPVQGTAPSAADLLQVSRQAVRKMSTTDPACPTVALSTTLGHLWRRTDVEAWIASRGTPRPGRRTADELALEQHRRAQRALTHAEDEIRDRAHQLAAAGRPRQVVVELVGLTTPSQEEDIAPDRSA